MEENKKDEKKYPSIVYFPDNKIKLFDENEVLDFREQKIKKEAMEIKDDNLKEREKILIVLSKMNTSNSSDNEETSFSFDEGSTNDSSLIKLPPSEKDKENYWLKYNIYDVKVSGVKVDNLSVCQLDNNIYCYFYSNKLTTYYYIQNVRFGKSYSKNDNTDSDYKEKYGLFFCGKNIEYNNNGTQLNVVCAPNKMICKNCMEKNKKRYNLDKSFLVNIIGRAAKKRKNGFHCYGHFFIEKLIEVCLDKFTCKACQLLDKYENYYISNN